MNEWEKIINISQELSSYFPDGIIFIGGLAVYQHSVVNKLDNYMLEQSHDSDFYISMSDFIDLKDIQEVTPNKRLSKYQFIKQNIDFDIYVENNHNLIVPFENMINNSLYINNLRVASLEHLLPLKLKAYEDRQNSTKGDKDRRDIVKIVSLINLNKITINKNEIIQFMNPDLIILCESISNSSAFIDLSLNNHYNAKKLKDNYLAGLSFIKDMCNLNKKDEKKWKLN